MMDPVKQALERLLITPAITRLASALLWSAQLFAKRLPVPAIAAPTRILVVKLDRIGDAILGSPFLRELRRAFPDAWITLVASHSVRPLVQHCPYVSEVLCIDSYAEGLRAKWRRFRENAHLAWTHLLARHYTHAILARYGVDHYMAYQLVAFSRASQRIGFTTDVDPVKAVFNAASDRLLTQVLPPQRRYHEVQRLLSILTAIGVQPREGPLELWLDQASQARAKQIAACWPENLIIGVCPASNEVVRDWPFERFVEIFTMFANRDDVRFVILGGPNLSWIERGLTPHRLAHVANLAGCLTLAESAAIVSFCDLFLSVDTGLMHCAAAQGVPIVEITSQPADGDPDHHHAPARFGPWQVKHRVVAPVRDRPEVNERLIERVTVTEVVAAMHSLLPALK